jgi:hypothetical protein
MAGPNLPSDEKRVEKAAPAAPAKPAKPPAAKKPRRKTAA